MIKKEYVDVNGQLQCMVTFMSSPKNPVIFYLHGGPGDSCTPLIETFNLKLMENFTLVVWEQRGSGLSYYKFTNQETLRIQDFVMDAKVLIETVLKEYNQEKVYLIGHSWGSVLGIMCLQQFPEYFYSYIGCGQVINMQETYSNQVCFIHRVDNLSSEDILEKTRIDFSSESWLQKVLYTTKKVVENGGSLYNKKNQNFLIKPFLKSKTYTLRDLIRRQKGSRQSLIMLWPELMEIDFSNVTELKVPVHLMEGKFDEHVSTEIAMEWYDALITKKTLTIFNKSGHFPQWEEAERFNMIVKDIFSQ